MVAFLSSFSMILPVFHEVTLMDLRNPELPVVAQPWTSLTSPWPTAACRVGCRARGCVQPHTWRTYPELQVHALHTHPSPVCSAHARTEALPLLGPRELPG